MTREEAKDFSWFRSDRESINRHIDAIFDDCEKMGQRRCKWEEHHSKQNSVTHGHLYIKGCDGTPEATMVDVSKLDKPLYCSACGGLVEIE